MRGRNVVKFQEKTIQSEYKNHISTYEVYSIPTTNRCEERKIWMPSWIVFADRVDLFMYLATSHSQAMLQIKDSVTAQSNQDSY